MLVASDFSLINAQAVIYTPEISAFSMSNFLACVLGEYAGRYDGDVQTIPLPETAPLEIPRVILQSKDGILRLDASPSRVNSVLTDNILASKSPEEVVAACTDVLKHYAEATEVRINRLALVVTWMHKTESSANFLVEQFCKPELKATIFQKSENFELHSHEKVTLKSFPTNSWIRCKTTELVTEDISKKIIAVEQDINTLSEEESRIFTTEEISEYFQLALFEINRFLEFYFPNLN
jgi:hypothetical protein